ncbi:dihydrodipicolinate synthase family protein [Pseudomonas sp. RIT-PI-AD]|uniref:dihydrodipicolinate synthase family protein n=1 Tax=Pseudomonas sp. RIT-PI-AD TaxID=3035294 RepID=UPI0021D9A23B|nr:dihydrodipicolinate synthase family protein [Pseudomonas sp. RIT-PI-AD]
MRKAFRGSYGVTVTPFTEDGSQIDEKALAAFIDWQVQAGSPGIIILGTTGEFLTLSHDERTRYVEATVKLAAGRLDVLVGASDAFTANAVRFAREAEALGADGLMVAPPYYYTPTDDEIFNYYSAVSEATSLPIMLYNNPITTNVDMSAALVARMTRALDNVRYIKEASMDVGRVYDIVEATRGVMNVFAGERPVESFLLGAVGYVNPYANYIPRASTRLWEALVDGRLEEARTIQAMIASFDHIIAEGHPTYGHQCYSKALAASQGYPVGDVRQPLTPFSALGEEGIQRRDRIVAIIDDLNRYVAAQAAR